MLCSPYQQITITPLFFFIYVRSGRVLIDRGQILYTGAVGYKWQASGLSNPGTVNVFYFDESTVTPSYSYNRWNAFPLRCLAKQ